MTIVITILQTLSALLGLLMFLVTITLWIRSGCRFPRYIHAMAVLALLLGVGMSWFANRGGPTSMGYTVGFIVAPPAIIYVGALFFGAIPLPDSRDQASFAQSLLSEELEGINVNFKSPTWNGVGQLIEQLERSFQSVDGIDGHGHQHTPPFAAGVRPIAVNSGGLDLRMSDGHGVLPSLQLFVSDEDNTDPFIELSFRPEDLKRTPDAMKELLAWLDDDCRILEANQFLVRRENESWTMWDTRREAGVIFVSSRTEDRRPGVE